MPYYSKKDYKIFGYQKSKTKGKKYDALLLKTGSPKLIRVPFGAIRPDGTPYPQYNDSTGLKLYKKYNHKNKERQKKYIARHRGFIKPGYYSAGQMSMDFLWS